MRTPAVGSADKNNRIRKVAEAVKRIQLLYSSVVRNGRQVHVFRSSMILRGLKWLPSHTKELLRASAGTLQQRGIIRLDNIESAGYRGIAFLTSEEAETLRQYFKLPTLEALMQTELVCSRETTTKWRPKRSLEAGPTFPPELKTVEQRKRWDQCAFKYFRGWGEAPPAVIVKLDGLRNLTLFNEQFSLYFLRPHKRVKIEAVIDKDKKLGIIIVRQADDRPIIDGAGHVLEGIVITDDGLIQSPRMVWGLIGQPQLNPAPKI